MDTGAAFVGPILVSRKMSTIAFLTLVLVFPVFAADKTVTLQAGWGFDPPAAPYSVMGNAFAVAAYQGAPPYALSRVIQVFGITAGASTSVLTDLPGKAFLLEYSTDGTRLLVHQRLPDAATDSIRVTLLNSSGQVLWTADGGRIYRFSTTGEALAAFVAGEFRGLGQDAEIYNLSRVLQRRVKYSDFVTGSTLGAGAGIYGFILVGTGDRAIISSDRATMLVSLTQPPAIEWQVYDPESYASDVVRSEVLDSRRIVLKLSQGKFKIVRVSNGTVQYSLDPVALAAADANPAHDRYYWSSYFPYAGATEGTVTLFNRSSTAYTLDLNAGTLTERTIDAATSAGFTLRERIDGQKIVIIGATQARIRALVP